MSTDLQEENGLTILYLASVIAEVDADIARLGERGPEQIGQVTRTRGIMRGAPVIAGTPSPTETIAWFHNQGYSVASILEEFPRLTPTDVRAALQFEKDRVAQPPDLLLARG